MIKRLGGTCVLVLGVLAFAGAAFAGNGNGNGNGNGSGTGAPGNSATAPGQVKKDASAGADAAAATTTTATTTTTADAGAGPTDGVKPSNDTAHDTHAAASSDETKKYGNGQTAGQIAIKRGAAPSTLLHGPGNSQPHKAAPCGRWHEVDVHALKSRRNGTCGGSTPQPSPTPTPTPSPGPGGPSTTTDTPMHPTGDPGTTPKGGRHATGGESTRTSTKKRQGVLAGVERVGRSETLPFTGQPLWLAVLIGLLLLLTGLGLRKIRTAESLVESRRERSAGPRDAARGSDRSGGGRAGR
jgi:hypothetical protein